MTPCPFSLINSLLEMFYYAASLLMAVRLRLTLAASPASPVPSRIMVAGSGTAVVAVFANLMLSSAKAGAATELKLT